MPNPLPKRELVHTTLHCYKLPDLYSDKKYIFYATSTDELLLKKILPSHRFSQALKDYWINCVLIGKYEKLNAGYKSEEKK